MTDDAIDTHPPVVCLLGEGWPPDRPGGLNRYFADLIGALHDIGVRPRGVAIGPAADAPTDVSIVGDASESLGRRLFAFTRAAVTESRRADVVDTHFALYGLLPGLIGAGRHKPQVVHFHGPWAAESVTANSNKALAARVKRRIERRVYRRADAIVTLSGAFRQVVVERYKVAPWRVSVIAPSVDLEHFSPGDRVTARARWSLSDDVKVVGCVRRLTARMGVDELLRAWASLHLDDPLRRVLLIGGEGEARDGLVALADELGVSDSVRFLGRLTEPELIDLYRAADLCVVPSVALEGFGLVVLEALACGTPVIATDVGGLPEALAGLADDAIVPAGEVDAMADRLDGALSGRLPLPVPDACVTHARAYSQANLAHAHLALYDRVAARRTDTRLRVVFLDHSALLSGAEIAMVRLIEALPDVAAHVVLAEEGPLVAWLRRSGISVEVLPLDAAARQLGRDRVRPTALPIATVAHTSSYIAQLTRRLRLLQPDVVHCNSLKACMYGSLAARAAGLPVVWHARDRMADDYLPPPAARAVRGLYRTAPAAAIANSEATLATFGPMRRHKPSIVVPDPFRRRRPVAATPTGPLRVGIVGRLADWKGQHIVLEAFARAFPGGPQRCAVIGSALFGEDSYATGLVALAADLGIADRVDFRGFRADVETEIDALHVLVHASVVPEPFGQVVVEGMAAGRAVIATAAGGPAEILTSDLNGLLYPAGDVEALARLLTMLDADATLRHRLGAAAIERAREFDPAVIGPRVERVYRQVLANA